MIDDAYYRKATTQGKVVVEHLLREFHVREFPVYRNGGAWKWDRPTHRISHAVVTFSIPARGAGMYGRHVGIADRFHRAGYMTLVKRAYRDRPTQITVWVPVDMPSVEVAS